MEKIIEVRPHRLLLIIAVILSAALSGGLFLSAQQSDIVTVYPATIGSYIENPGIGWQNVPGNQPYLLPETVGYATREDISWQVLNPGDGVYNWSVLEALIQDADAQGKLFSFRIYTMQGETFGGHHVPQWVLDIDPSVIQATNEQPDYANCTYQDTWATFVAALIQQYDGDSRIAFIDISGYGNFNEWSWTDGQTVWEDDYHNPLSLDGLARNRLADMFIGGSNPAHSCLNVSGVPEARAYDYAGF